MKYLDYLEEFRKEFCIDELEKTNSQQAYVLVNAFNKGFSAGSEWTINETI